MIRNIQNNFSYAAVRMLQLFKFGAVNDLPAARSNSIRDILIDFADTPLMVHVTADVQIGFYVFLLLSEKLEYKSTERNVRQFAFGKLDGKLVRRTAPDAFRVKTETNVVKRAAEIGNAVLFE